MGEGHSFVTCDQTQVLTRVRINDAFQTVNISVNGATFGATCFFISTFLVLTHKENFCTMKWKNEKEAFDC